MNPFPRLTLQALLESHFPAAPDRAQNIKDFRAVFLDSDQGRRVLAMIVARSDWLQPRTSVSNIGVDPLLAAFNEGRKSMAEWVASMIDGSTDEPQQEARDGGRDDSDDYH